MESSAKDTEITNDISLLSIGKDPTKKESDGQIR